MVWNVLLTITTDFTWRLDLEIWPGDMTRRLDPETWPGDLTQRLDPETWPRDFIQRLHTETSPRDFTKRLTWSDPFLQTLPGDLALETWPGHLTRRLDPETWPRDFIQRLHTETSPKDSPGVILLYNFLFTNLKPKIFQVCMKMWEKKTDFQRFCKMCLSCLAHSEYVWWFYWVFLDFHGNIMGNDVSQKYST